MRHKKNMAKLILLLCFCCVIFIVFVFCICVWYFVVSRAILEAFFCWISVLDDVDDTNLYDYSGLNFHFHVHINISWIYSFGWFRGTLGDKKFERLVGKVLPKWPYNSNIQIMGWWLITFHAIHSGIDPHIDVDFFFDKVVVTSVCASIISEKRGPPSGWWSCKSVSKVFPLEIWIPRYFLNWKYKIPKSTRRRSLRSMSLILKIFQFFRSKMPI